MEHKFIIISSNKRIGKNEITFKQALIAAALNSVSGKSQLAAAMAAPLRHQLNYSGIARRALSVQQLPQGGQFYYNKDLKVTSCLIEPYKHDSIIITSNKVIGQSNRIIGRVAWGKRVTVPTFEIQSNPTVKISDIKSRRFNMIDRYTRETHGQVVIGPNKRIGLWNKVKRNGIGILNKAVQKARDEIMAQEDAAIFKALDDAVAAGIK